MGVFCHREESGKDRSLGLPLHRYRSTTETWKDDRGDGFPLGYMWEGRPQGWSLQHSRNLSTLSCKRFHGIRISDSAREGLGLSEEFDYFFFQAEDGIRDRCPPHEAL